MCYAAQVEQELNTLRNAVKARVDLAAYERLFKRRLTDKTIKIVKGMEANFYHPRNADEERIHDLIQQHYFAETKKLETELFKQKKRLATAERLLQVSENLKASEDQRIAKKKIPWLLDKIADLKRTTVDEDDSRVFPKTYAPVLIVENGERIIRPMRYQCRPAGMPVSFDTQRKGTYNARRDNLEKFWRRQFCHTHAIVLMTGFYEHVAQHTYEHRELREGEKEKDLILHFNPKPTFLMKVACLWSHWTADGEEPLDSFAAITDEPPVEVSAAGHDRCIIPIKDTNLDRWLNPRGFNASEQFAILDDRKRPYYEHRMAA